MTKRTLLKSLICPLENRRQVDGDGANGDKVIVYSFGARGKRYSVTQPEDCAWFVFCSPFSVVLLFALDKTHYSNTLKPRLYISHLSEFVLF